MPETNTDLSHRAEAWFKSREHTNRANKDDQGRWKNHLEDRFGSMEPEQVTAPMVKDFVAEKLGLGMNPATIGHCVRLLSSLYTDLLDREVIGKHPLKPMPRYLKRLIKPTHRPQDTPFLGSMEDAEKITMALPSEVGILFATGVYGGLRLGESRGLMWADIDFDRGLISVKRQMTERGKIQIVKDGEGRTIPLTAALRRHLERWKEQQGADRGLYVAPLRPRQRWSRYLLNELYEVMDRLGIERCTWYEATRHTFASHFVLRGGQLEMLCRILGHSSVVVTERYAHLRTATFEAERALFQ